jgi:hypothetical protein
MLAELGIKKKKVNSLFVAFAKERDISFHLGVL